MEVTCTNPECKNTWNYQGKGRWYATCTQCHKMIRIRELLK